MLAQKYTFVTDFQHEHRDYRTPDISPILPKITLEINPINYAKALICA